MIKKKKETNEEDRLKRTITEILKCNCCDEAIDCCENCRENFHDGSNLWCSPDCEHFCSPNCLAEHTSSNGQAEFQDE